MDSSQPTTEHELAAGLGIEREALARLRKERLTPGEDYANIPRLGITYTAGGLEKIKGALAVAPPSPEPVTVPEKEAPPPAPPGVELEVLRPSNVGRQAICCVPGYPAQRRFVTVHGRWGATTLTRGQRLQGCRQRFTHNAEVFDYHGPLPRRKGQPMPINPPAPTL